MWKQKYEELLLKYNEAEKKLGELLVQIGQNEKLRETITELRERNKFLKEDLEGHKEEIEAVHKIKDGLLRILPSHIATTLPTHVPSEISVAIEQPAITLQRRTPPLTLNDSSLEGKIAIVYAEGKLPLGKWFTVTDVTKAFQSRGWSRDSRTSKVLDKFCQWGYFEKQMSGRRSDYRIRLSSEDARSKGLLKEVDTPY